MSKSLLSILPKPNDLLALAPEDLGGVIIEVVPSLIQRGMFNINSLLSPLYPVAGTAYPASSQHAVVLALAEALTWLSTQGLIVIDPQQPALWYRVTRRAANLHQRADVEAFRKGRILPDDLVPSLFARKVVPLIRRGDFDVAVFQAFKEVEVAVRNTATRRHAVILAEIIFVSLQSNESCATHLAPPTIANLRAETSRRAAHPFPRP